jgi:Na+/H+ antiporter NhaC
LLALPPVAWAAPEIGVEPDRVALSGVPFSLTVIVSQTPGPIETRLLVNGREVDRRTLPAGSHRVKLEELKLPPGRHNLRVEGGGASAEAEARVILGWLALLPPIIAISLALIFKDVLVSLFVGIFSGALLLFEWNPVTAFVGSVEHFVVPQVADSTKAGILVFTLFLGGMVGLITRSGGTHGIVDRVHGLATNARRGQLTTWLLGVLVFFDDYANALIVGSTMRPVTDRLRISREKLAYIVDSTAAPVASVFPISSWIGFEVGLIAGALVALQLPYNAYTTFLASIPYRFYPLFALVLGFTIAATGRDFGPMLKAERRASKEGKVLADDAVPLADYRSKVLAPPEGAPQRAFNAFLPILTVIAVALFGFVNRDFRSPDFDSIPILLWASFTGMVMAAVLPFAQRILTIRQSMAAMVEGFKSMVLALAVLVLAWSIGSVCTELHTADFVVELTRDILSPFWLPVLIFALSAIVAFATGTSWGTLGILMPIVVPIANGLALAAGMPVQTAGYDAILVGTISSVLAGSVWGDHCSPISDTTILSSTASGCDHIAHVRTQMPYALAAGILGMLVGDIPTAYGLPPWISLLVGSAIIVIGVRWLGRRSDQ